MKYLDEIIAGGLFDEIRKADRMTAYSGLKITGKEYRKDEIVFREGDSVNRFCIIKSGSVRAEKTYPGGEVHITEVFGKGAVFALEFAVSKRKTSAMDFVSCEDTTVIFVNMNSIEQSEFADRMNRSLTYMLADNSIRMGHKIDILAERGLRARIMAYLRVLQTKSGTDTVTVMMGREQLAQFLCVNRSALSNELSKMKRDGIIDFSGNVFTIKE